MLSTKILEVFRDQSATAISKLEQVVFPLLDKVESIEKDDTIGKPERAARIRNERAAVEAKIVELVRQVQAASAEVSGQRRFWENSAFVLSQQRFSELASTHAQIAAWNAQRLARLPLPQLALEFADAVSTKDFPMLSLILTERMGRNVAPADLDSTDFSLAGVAIADQGSAISHLDTVEANDKYATHLFRTARGMQISAADKMARGRADPTRKPTAQPHAIVTVREDLAETSASRAVQAQPALD